MWCIPLKRFVPVRHSNSDARASSVPPAVSEPEHPVQLRAALENAGHEVGDEEEGEEEGHLLEHQVAEAADARDVHAPASRGSRR